MPIETEELNKLPGTIPSANQHKQVLFELGRCVATPAVLRHLEASGADPMHYIRQHSYGVWGDLSGEDARENELSVANGYRVLSAYTVAGIKFFIITEADRSVTTLLLPSEY